MKRVFFDLEFYAYRHCSAAVECMDWGDGDWCDVFRHGEAMANLRQQVIALLAKFPRPEYLVVFCRGQGENFRKKLLPEYKANRKKRRPPGNYTKFLAEANTMARQLGCDVWRHPGIEGDDIIGLYLREGDVVVSGDKDMRTLAGAHLLPDGTVEIVSEFQANRKLYEQILTGDTSDGYKGCPKYGEVAARKALADCHTEQAMWEKVLGCYLKSGLDVEFALAQARCARILRAGEYDLKAQTPVLWNPPVT